MRAVVTAVSTEFERKDEIIIMLFFFDARVYNKKRYFRKGEKERTL